MHAPELIGPEARKDLHRGWMEVEAESVASSAVCSDSLPAPIPSATSSDGDVGTITETAKVVLAAVHVLTEALDGSAAENETDEVA